MIMQQLGGGRAAKAGCTEGLLQLDDAQAGVVVLIALLPQLILDGPALARLLLHLLLQPVRHARHVLLQDLKTGRRG